MERADGAACVALPAWACGRVLGAIMQLAACAGRKLAVVLGAGGCLRWWVQAGGAARRVEVGQRRWGKRVRGDWCLGGHRLELREG
jgi:hypothetical protein